MQLDVSAVDVAVNSIGVSLGGRVSDLQSVVGAYTMPLAAFILTAAGSAIGVALFGSLVATSFASGLRVVLVISVGLMLVVLCLSELYGLRNAFLQLWCANTAWKAAQPSRWALTSR